MERVPNMRHFDASRAMEHQSGEGAWTPIYVLTRTLLYTLFLYRVPNNTYRAAYFSCLLDVFHFLCFVPIGVASRVS